MLHILIVEDEKPIADLIAMTLRQAGYRCTILHNGLDAADWLEANRCDLALRDIMLPGADGYELLEYVRPQGIPVIFLTAKTELNDRVRGLHSGADDYICKPFAPPELVARVETVLRRCGRGREKLCLWGVELDPEQRTVTKDGSPVELTPREFDLLLYLMRTPGVALYRDVLFERVWGALPEEDTRTLDLHIARLRQKLGWQERITTVYRIGYRLEKEESAREECL